MIASILDLCTKMNDIMKALDRNEKVTLPRCGKCFAVIATACEHQLTLCNAKKKTLQNINALDFQPFISETAPNA